MLRAEVDKFNAMVDAGEDTDFGRDITTMAKIEQGPFYAIEEVPSMPACSGGARRNIKGQVLNWDGEPIEGLYPPAKSAPWSATCTRTAPTCMRRSAPAVPRWIPCWAAVPS